MQLLATPFTRVTRCWICGGSAFRRVHEEWMDLRWFYKYDSELAGTLDGCRFWISRCQDCGFAQPDRLPSLPNVFDRLYGKPRPETFYESEFQDTSRDFVFQTVLDSLAVRLPPERRKLLDVGAFVGKFVSVALQKGWQAEGVELQPKAVAYAQQRGLPVRCQDAHDLGRVVGASFDAVTLNDVLEHIPEPLHILKTVAQLLRPGGWIAVKSPCGLNQLVKERLLSRIRTGHPCAIATNFTHVNHFSVGSLRLALEKAGFHNIQIEVAAPELEHGNDAGRRDRWDRALRLSVYHLCRMLPFGVHSPLCLNLQAFACKA